MAEFRNVSENPKVDRSFVGKNEGKIQLHLP